MESVGTGPQESDALGRPELVFGLVGAAGTDLNVLTSAVSDELRALDYKPHLIVVSDLLAELPKYKHLEDLRSGPEEVRINKSMDAGNDLRQTLETGAGAIWLAISKIRQIRKDVGGKSEKRLAEHAFVIKSLKNPAESEALRRIYGDAFIQISAYEPTHIRMESLATRIAKSHGRFEWKEFESQAREIIQRDEKEKGIRLGQNVSMVFPLADYFVSTGTQLRQQTERFIHILFGSPFRTPLIDEYGMFHAFAAARRSADLSRQVGAVVTTSTGELICAGCNEVPQAAGGSVWESIPKPLRDYRDFNLGQDPSAGMKREIVRDTFDALKSAGWLAADKQDLDVDQLTELALDPSNPVLGERRIADIIEYGRIVHAEMSALMDAVRRGMSVRDATLYCTTFPCHMCARHLMAAGLKRVVYIEPYPKSMAKQLYRKSIQVDNDTEADPDALKFDSFAGVAPRRYFELFDKLDRKDATGYALPDRPSREPRIRNTLEEASDLEVTYVNELDEPKYKLFDDPG